MPVGAMAPVPDGGAGGAGRCGGGLPAVAAALVDRLDCAVLAMRFPVVDDFAIALAGSFYDLVLGKGQPVARALALTLPRVLAEPADGGRAGVVGGHAGAVRGPRRRI